MTEHTQICQSCGETVEGNYSLLDHDSGAHGYVYQCTNMSCMETWEEDEAPADEDSQTTPQDSQTLTADDVQVRREDLEFAVSVLDIATAWADDPTGHGLEAYLRLRAALNQGQG